MRIGASVVLMLLILGSLSCEEKKDAKPSAVSRSPTKVPFVPPTDSTVTVQQVKNWLRCSNLLDSLSYIYRDSFAVEDPVRLTNYQREFTKAQDKLCVVAGLPGGYEEYVWILR
ncbi:MAG: hypothetical protein GF344_00930, partial [Chitinivibrionales bacterium]|nr:hypothetical protein [Chitinivibrionales bacterium]